MTALQRWLPRLVLSPTLVLILVCVYGFILFTAWISLTDSRFVIDPAYMGFDHYERLFEGHDRRMLRDRRWNTSVINLAVFASLYISLCLIIGLLLAILLDQKIRGEGVLRPIYLYPMAISFIVTGTAWKWFLDPGIGLEATMHGLGWTSFEFRWIKDRNMALYTIVIAAVWQSSGFVMAMFLAGLRGVDNEVIKAAQIDGASTFSLYRRIILPQLGPAFLSAIVVLAHLAIKAYDLVIAMTSGGPGTATWLPSVFVYQHMFTRNQMGLGAGSAVIMLAMVAAIMVPYIYAQTREKSS